MNFVITKAEYHRSLTSRFMTGKKQEKHVTADTVKDALYARMKGMKLTSLPPWRSSCGMTIGNFPAFSS